MLPLLLALIIAVVRIEACTNSNLGSISSVQVAPPAGPYVRCNSHDVAVCRQTSCYQDEVQQPDNTNFKTLLECTDYKAYYLCYNTPRNSYTCKTDIPGCTTSTAVDYRYPNVNTQFSTLDQCLAYIPASVYRCLNSTGRYCRPQAAGNSQLVGCQSTEMLQPQATLWTNEPECLAFPAFVKCYNKVTDAYNCRNDTATPRCITPDEIQLSNSFSQSDCSAYIAANHMRCVIGTAAAGYTTQTCRPVEKVTYVNSNTADTSPQVFSTLTDACNTPTEGTAPATAFSTKASCLDYYACRPCYTPTQSATPNAYYTVSAVSDTVSGQCGTGMLLTTAYTVGSAADPSTANSQCVSWYNTTQPLTHVRCGVDASTMICRPKLSGVANTGCQQTGGFASETEKTTQGTTTWPTLGQCNDNLFAVMPCYGPTTDAGNGYNTMTAITDMESCAGNTWQIGNYSFGPGLGPLQTAATSFYTNNKESLTHQRCGTNPTPADVTANQVVCRPFSVTGASTCIPGVSGETALTSSPSSSSYASYTACMNNRYYAKACYVATANSYQVKCVSDMDSATWCGNANFQLTSYSPYANTTAAQTACDDAYTTSSTLTHVRCRVDNANVICRPLRSTTTESCPASLSESPLSTVLSTWPTLPNCTSNKYIIRYCYDSGTPSARTCVSDSITPSTCTLLLKTFADSTLSTAQTTCDNDESIIWKRCSKPAAPFNGVNCRPLSAGCITTENSLTGSSLTLNQCNAYLAYVSCYAFSTNTYGCANDYTCYLPNENVILTTAETTNATCNAFTPTGWVRCLITNPSYGQRTCRPVEAGCMTNETQSPSESNKVTYGFSKTVFTTRTECESFDPHISCYDKATTLFTNSSLFDCREDYLGPCQGDYKQIPNDYIFTSLSNCQNFGPQTWLRCINSTTHYEACRPYDATVQTSCPDGETLTESFASLTECRSYERRFYCYSTPTSPSTVSDGFSCENDYDTCGSNARIPNDGVYLDSSCSQKIISTWQRCTNGVNRRCRPYDSSTYTNCSSDLSETRLPSTVYFSSFDLCDAYDARKNCYDTTSTTTSTTAFDCGTEDYENCPADTVQIPSGVIFESATACGTFAPTKWVRCTIGGASYCRPFDVLCSTGESRDPLTFTFDSATQCQNYQPYTLCYVPATNYWSCIRTDLIGGGNCPVTLASDFANSGLCNSEALTFHRCMNGITATCRPTTCNPTGITGETECGSTSTSFSGCYDIQRYTGCYNYQTNTYSCRLDTIGCSSAIEFNLPDDACYADAAACNADVAAMPDEQHLRCVFGSVVVCRPEDAGCYGSETATPSAAFDNKAQCLAYTPGATERPVACYTRTSNTFSCVASGACGSPPIATLAGTTTCEQYVAAYTPYMRCRQSNSVVYCAPFDAGCGSDTQLPVVQNFTTRAECEGYQAWYSCYDPDGNVFQCQYDSIGCQNTLTRIPAGVTFLSLESCRNDYMYQYKRCVSTQTGKGAYCRPSDYRCRTGPDPEDVETESPPLIYPTETECQATKVYYWCYKASEAPTSTSGYTIPCVADTTGCNTTDCSGALDSDICQRPVRVITPNSGAGWWLGYSDLTACRNNKWYKCRSGTSPSYVYKCRPKGGEVNSSGAEQNNGCKSDETRVPDTFTEYVSLAQCLA